VFIKNSLYGFYELCDQKSNIPITLDFPSTSRIMDNLPRLSYLEGYSYIQDEMKDLGIALMEVTSSGAKAEIPAI